jgi:uncharacterized coiled-coil protein SlyX
VQLIRDQEQKITELAGQVGYLQSELSRTREQLQLAAPYRTLNSRRYGIDYAENRAYERL